MSTTIGNAVKPEFKPARCGGLGVTPGVARAYAALAVGFFAVEKFGTSTVILSHPEMPLAAPAE